jgi:uncharacterized protein (TIGR03086 family)
MTWNAAEMYAEGLTFFTTVVDGAPPDAWDRPSPCADWTALDVLGHVGEATGMGVRILRGDDITFTRHDPPGSVVDGDPAEWWHELADDAAATFTDDIALDRVVDSPLGPRTVREGLSFPAVDLFIHGWDLAAASGQTVTFPDEAVAFTRMMFDTVPEERSRSAGVFGPARPAPDDASPTEALLAWAGRDPHWAPQR